MKSFISVLFATLVAAAQTEHIDIDWSQVKPISELPEYKAALDNLAPINNFIESRNLRIVGGKPASKSQFPYQAGLLLTVSGSQYLCGGSIISRTRVLTAAHCTKGASTALVMLGAINIYENELTQVRMNIPARGIIYHSEFNPQSLQNDVGMIKLPSAVVYNNFISPIALPENVNDFADITAVASGWGHFDYTRQSSSFLRFVNLKIIGNSRCRIELPVTIYDSTICAMGDGDVGTCNGDSGGPLAVKKNDKRILIGVTSFGINRRCGNGVPVGFARVTSFMPWIKSNM